MDQKVELIRIMIDALNSLGYKRTGVFLERETGINIVHNEQVRSFVNQVIEGKWDESLSTLHNIGFIDEKFAEVASMTILNHKLSELLYEGKFTEALNTLRNQIAPVCQNEEVLVHEYCVYFVIPSMNVVKGAHSYGEKALEDLRDLLPTDRVGRENIPSRTVQILKEHKDEVWFLQFSHNGKYLASSSKDGLVILWQVTEATKEVCKIRVLQGHTKPVSHISWRRDDSQLLTCGVEEAVVRDN